jgi:hypothetical protein
MRIAPSLVLLVASAAPALGQLPDPSVDVVLGLRARQQVLQSRHVVSSTKSSQTGHRVFAELLGTTPIRFSGLPYSWDMTVLSGNDLGAFSTAGGQVYVLNGLSEILGERKALWAAVIGHELAHTAQRHHVIAYWRALEMNLRYEQQKAYYQKRAAEGDQSAQWALAGLEIGRAISGLVELKLSREEEHDADRLAMLMMAEAGYHPAYVFVLHHTLKTYLGDQSKFAAFFSTHPRWETRAQRSHRIYREAVTAFEQRWSDPALSPGGIPPPIVFLGKPETKELKDERVSVIRIPLQMEEGSGQVVFAYALLLDKNARISTPSPEYRDEKGLFLAAQPMQVSAPSRLFRVDCGTSLNELSVFAAPGSKTVATLKCGETIDVVGSEDSWVRVRLKDGTEGFVSGLFVSDTTSPPTSTQLMFQIPTSVLPSNKRKLKSRVCVTTFDGLLLNCTKEFNIKFPKLKRP